MLPLRLAYEPVFDIKKDLDKIAMALLEGKNSPRSNKSLFPTARAYIVDENLEPVAIFDHPGPGFGGLIKLVAAVMPKAIDNPCGYQDVEVMNIIRQAVHSEGFSRPYTVAAFVGDEVHFHFRASTDLVIVLCERLSACDIVDRGWWEFVYDSGVE